MIGLRNILNIPRDNWRTMLQHCVQWIRADFKTGKMQDGQSGLQYKSEQYKKYKANAMKRFTKTKVKKEKTTGIEYLGMKKSKSGKRLGNYYAKAIESTQTAFVDMTLSGDLKRGLKVKSVSATGGIIGYEPEDAKKLEGNRRYGREVVGLNEENQEKLKKELVAILNKNAQTILSKDIKVLIIM